jgi:hypothetical protein
MKQLTFTRVIKKRLGVLNRIASHRIRELCSTPAQSSYSRATVRSG